jgi:hypothetical protein
MKIFDFIFVNWNAWGLDLELKSLSLNFLNGNNNLAIDCVFDDAFDDNIKKLFKLEKL